MARWLPLNRMNAMKPLFALNNLVVMGSLLTVQLAAQESQPAPGIKPNADGVLLLEASAAGIHGQTARFEVLEGLRTRTAAERARKPVQLPDRVFVVPNFHPASCGWLANWSVERNYCANSYLNHLDRVRDDANYGYAQSECNTMIAIANFQPQRFEELKERVKQGRVELVNAFFLESTINLSGGEALAKMGIEGLRWQQQVMGMRPRFCWTIDVCGTHAQMPQLCEQLGLEGLIYTRCNRSGKTVFWSESPDGSRVLTLVPGGYAENLGGAYAARQQLTQAQLAQAARAISSKLPATPVGAPVLVLGGYGDYSLAPPRHEHPTEFLEQWKKAYPECDLRYGGLSPFVDALMPGVKSGKIELPTGTHRHELHLRLILD